MKSDDKLLRNAFNGFFITNLISMISVMLCIIIDSIVTGKFLGPKAVTAAGLISPIALLVQMVCGLFGPGLGVTCSKYIGMANIKRVNQVFTIVIITTVCISSLVAIFLFFGAPVLSVMLSDGADDAEISNYITSYLRGLSLGVVFSAVSMTLTGIMMIDNDKDRAMMSTIIVLICDAIFDISNVLIFHGGMFGMALATSLSGFVGFIVLVLHFRKQDRIIRFTPHELKFSDLSDTLSAGFSGSISQMCMVVRGVVINQLLLTAIGAGAVASYAIALNSFTVVTSLLLAVIITTSTLCSMMYGEEDRLGLIRALRLSIRNMLMIMLVIAIVFFIIARPVASIFLKDGSPEVIDQAARFIRFFCFQYSFAAFSYPFSGGLLGVRRFGLNYLVTVLREGVFPIFAVMALSSVWGINGVEAAFPIAGILTLISVFIAAGIIKRKFPISVEDFVLLPSNFGTTAEDLFEASMKSMDDVISVSKEISNFCKNKGVPNRTAMLTALFVEEMAGNIVQHGFGKKAGESIDLRLVYSDDKKIIRLRDNGTPFDPVKWLEQNHPDDPSSAIGIRMIVGMAREIQYMQALQMNNLIVTL